MPNILGVCGSPRSGATEYALKEALKVCESFPGITTDFWSVKGKKIKPCVHCDGCVKNSSMCVIKDDFQEFESKFIKADAVIIASPVYDMTISAQLAAVFNRFRPAYLIYPGEMKYKPGGAIVTAGTRHGGQEFALQAILNFYLLFQMSVVGGLGGCYNGGKIWSKDNGAEGAIEDTVGMETVLKLAKAMAEATIVSFEGRKYLHGYAKEHNIDISSKSPISDQ